MALFIDIPDVSWSEQNISLGGITYKFVFRYNSRDKRWRLDIYQGAVTVKEGITIVPEIGLIQKYQLDLFSHGELVCGKFSETENTITRDNFGKDKAFRLIYFSNSEILA